MYDVRDTLPFSAKLYDSAGALVNATTVTLTITLPDQTTTSPAVTNPPAVAGTYSYNYPAAGGALLPGRYVGFWLFTMATGQTTSYSEVFDVAPADPGFIISLSQGKAQLNITSTNSDDELGLYLAAVTRVVEKFVGPVVIRPYTQVVPADRPFLTYLPRLGPGLTPVLTLTSLTPLYTTGIGTWLAAGAFPDPVTGELRQTSGQCIYGGPWTAVYTAGQQVVDPTWQLAAAIILQHLWKTQRGASALPLQAADETFLPEVGYAIPNRALDLLRVDALPGIA